MTEATGNPSITTQQSDVPPWEKSWGRGRGEVGEISSTDTSLPPWAKEWGRGRSSYVPPQEPSNSFDFDTVFERLIQAESRGRHRSSTGGLTTSPVGAQGISQVMPKTGRDPGYGVKPLQDDSEEEYLRFGRDYLKAMLNEFGEDYRKAVAAYNAGPGSVKKAVAAAEKKGGDWTQYLPKKSESIPYMNKILGEG